MDREADPAQTTLRYGRGRSVVSALILIATSIGFWAIFALTIGQGTATWPVIVGGVAISALVTALALNAIGMAIGPNEILLTREGVAIRRGFESASVPWTKIHRIDDRKIRVNGVPMHYLDIHVRERSDVTLGGSGRILARLSRSRSLVLAIALRAGIPLILEHDPDEASAVIRRHFTGLPQGPSDQDH